MDTDITEEYIKELYGLGDDDMNLLYCESIIPCKYFEEEQLLLA